MQNRLTVSAAAAATMLIAAAGQALAHVGDAGLAVVNNRIVTGIVEEPMPGTEVVVPGERVFGGDFFDQGGVVYSDNPGLFAENGTFAAGSRLTFRILGAVRRWNGSNFDDLATERIRIELGAATPVLSPVTDTIVNGFGFTVPAVGGFDEHYDFFLTNASGADITVPALPAPATNTGVFLLPLDLSTDQPGIARSEPFWFVLNWGEDEAVHDEAIEFVEEFIVPAPGAAALLGLGGLLAGRRRR